jgi:hypothetical protein
MMKPRFRLVLFCFQKNVIYYLILYELQIFSSIDEMTNTTKAHTQSQGPEFETGSNSDEGV